MENYLAELAYAHWKFLKKKAEKPFVGDYAPDMDDNPTLPWNMT